MRIRYIAGHLCPFSNNSPGFLLRRILFYSTLFKLYVTIFNIDNMVIILYLYDCIICFYE